MIFFFFFQAEDGIRDYKVTGVQTCALPISSMGWHARCHARLRQLLAAACCLSALQALQAAAAPVAAADRDLDTDIGMVAAAAAAAAPASTSANTAAAAPDPVVLRLAQHLTPGTLASDGRSEEHTSELQSPCNLVCRLLLA